MTCRASTKGLMVKGEVYGSWSERKVGGTDPAAKCIDEVSMSRG